MSLIEKIDSMVTAVNTLMGVIDAKLRGKSNSSDIYTRTYLDNPLNTLGANAATADKLKTARSITLSGDANGSVSFDGSGNVTLSVTVPSLPDKADKSDVVTPAEMDAKIQQVIGVAPELLNTFEEFAKALGDDPNFAASMASELAKKANKLDVFTKTESTKNFLPKSGTAENTVLFGGKTPSHYATDARLSSLENEMSSAFSQLTTAFTDGANTINVAGA